jgi:hypothetical protein
MRARKEPEKASSNCSSDVCNEKKTISWWLLRVENCSSGVCKEKKTISL